MAEADRSEDTPSYGAMGMEERRAMNIHRQQQYLTALFGSCDQTTAVEDSRSSESLQGPHEETRLEDEIFGRRTEVSKLTAFLARDFELSDALVVYGPSGAGKTSIVKTVLRKSRIPYCTVLCSGYSTARQLIRAVWLSLQSSSSTEGGPHLTDSCPGQNGIPSTFEDLVEYVSSLTNTNVLFLDKIDVVEDLQKDLSKLLLSLPDISNNSRLKVIGTATVFCGWRTFLLEFPPYSDLEIESILKTKANSLRDPYKLKALRVISRALRKLLFGTRHCGQLWCVIERISRMKDEDHNAEELIIQEISNDSFQIPREAQTLCDNECTRVCLSFFTLTSTDAGRSWIFALTHTTKIVLLAAFCAGTNSKKSDGYQFGAYKRGKRKRENSLTIVADDMEQAAESGVGYSFSLERLSGIFIQISSRVVTPNVVGDAHSSRALRRTRCVEPRDSFRETIKNYGDAYFASSIAELVACRILVPRSNWRLDCPLYTWCILLFS